MTTVSRVMMISTGLATTKDHRSDARAARDLGVISPKVTMRTVKPRVATRVLSKFSAMKEITRTVPTEEARMMNRFSVKRMVAKNFSCFPTTLLTAAAALLPMADPDFVDGNKTGLRAAEESYHDYAQQQDQG